MFSDSLVIMKLQFICLLIALLILVSSCNTAPKTQPIIIEEGVEEEQKEEPEENDIVDVTGAITKEIVENASNEINETSEINETEEEDTKTIVIEDLKFKPTKITIPIGTTVVWEHTDRHLDRDDIVHIVMVYPIAERSDRMFYGDKFNVTFDKPGEYYFIDIVFKESMRGDITV